MKLQLLTLPLTSCCMTWFLTSDRLVPVSGPGVRDAFAPVDFWVLERFGPREPLGWEGNPRWGSVPEKTSDNIGCGMMAGPQTQTLLGCGRPQLETSSGAERWGRSLGLLPHMITGAELCPGHSTETPALTRKPWTMITPLSESHCSPL